MMTSARPMAISRSRVQTRISWRREFAGADRSEITFAVAWAPAITEDATGAGISGCGVAAKGFSFELSIFGCLIFIACSLRRAPDAFCRRATWTAEPLGFFASNKIQKTVRFVAH